MYAFVGYMTVYNYYAYPEKIRPRIRYFIFLFSIELRVKFVIFGNRSELTRNLQNYLLHPSIGPGKETSLSELLPGLPQMH